MSEKSQLKTKTLKPKAFALYEILKTYWGETGPNDRRPIRIRTVVELFTKSLADAGFELTFLDISNLVTSLITIGILKKHVRKVDGTEKERVFVEFNWIFLETHEVVQKADLGKDHPQKGSGAQPPSDNDEPPKWKHSPEPDEPRLRIMLALPDNRTIKFQKARNASEHIIAEDDTHRFRIILTEQSESKLLGLAEFISSVVHACLMRTTFCVDSVLEAKFGKFTVDNEKVLTTVALIARGALDCKLNGIDMIENQEYPLEHDVPNLLMIDSCFIYVARALGF